MSRTPALEKTEESLETVVSGGRFVTHTAVFFGAEGVGAGFDGPALPFSGLSFLSFRLLRRSSRAITALAGVYISLAAGYHVHSHQHLQQHRPLVEPSNPRHQSTLLVKPIGENWVGVTSGIQLLAASDHSYS